MTILKTAARETSKFPEARMFQVGSGGCGQNTPGDVSWLSRVKGRG